MVASSTGRASSRRAGLLHRRTRLLAPIRHPTTGRAFARRAGLRCNRLRLYVPSRPPTPPPIHAALARCNRLPCPWLAVRDRRASSRHSHGHGRHSNHSHSHSHRSPSPPPPVPPPTPPPSPPRYREEGRRERIVLHLCSLLRNRQPPTPATDVTRRPACTATRLKPSAYHNPPPASAVAPPSAAATRAYAAVAPAAVNSIRRRCHLHAADATSSTLPTPPHRPGSLPPRAADPAMGRPGACS